MKTVLNQRTILRANQSMISSKDLSSYDLPESVKNKIAKRKYSEKELNDMYARYREGKLSIC